MKLYPAAWFRQALLLVSLATCIAAPVAAQKTSGLPVAPPLTSGAELVPCSVPNVATYKCSLTTMLTTSAVAKAQRLIRAAARGITPLNSVMATPPTITLGAINAASFTGAGINAPSYAANSPRIRALNGPLAVQGAGYRSQARTNGLVAGRTGTNGSGLAFMTMAPKVGLAFGSTSQTTYMVYVTDVQTGLRQRIAANDLSTNNGSGLAETLLQFGDGSDTNARLRIFELYAYSGSTIYNGINVDTTKYQVFYPNILQDDVKVLLFTDSWGEGVGNGATNPVRLSQPGLLGERLGLANIYSSSLGGTGYLATNNGAALNFLARLQAGDADAARIGAMDFMAIPTSVNDASNAGGFTTAQLRTQVPLVLAAARTAQPGAILLVWGPQVTTSTVTDQSWFDATANGVADYLAASGDQNVIYIDNSPAGLNWLNPQIDTVIFNGINAHPNDLGMIYWPYQVANGVLAAVRAKAGLVSALLPRDRPANDNAPAEMAA